MKCSKCGFENKDGSKFCLKCGNKLAEEAQSELCFDEGNITNENNVGTESSDISENISQKSEHTASVVIDPPKINKKFVISLSAVAVIIISAATVGILAKNSDDDFYEPEPSSVSMTETAAQTTLTEAVTSATTAKTTVITKQTTRATTTTTAAATTTQAETMPIRSNEAHFSLSCGTIDFVDNNFIYKINSDDYYYDYISYYQLTPYVDITNSEVSSKIEKVLTEALSFSGKNESEYGEIVNSIPADNFGLVKTEYERRVKSIYEENGLIFISVVDYSDFGGGTISSIFSYVKTYVFDTATGEQYDLSDFITDRESFEYVVDEYIENIIYDEVSVNNYPEYLSILESNYWINGEWEYDGENLTVTYHYLLGFADNYKDSSFDIPAYVWRDYLDFSVNNSSSKVTVTNIDDSYKEDKSYTTDPGYIEGPPSNFDELGLYWIFSDNDGGHNLKHIAELAAENSYNDWTADDFYVFLNENWTYYCGCWYFTSGHSSLSDSEMVIGEPGETGYIEYARIPFKEYKPYLNGWYFQ